MGRLCGKLKGLDTTQRPAAYADLLASNPLGVMWVQLTLAATEGCLPVVVEAQQSEPGCAQTVQRLAEVPVTDPG